MTEFAPNAFQNIPLGNYSPRLKISPNIVSVGAHCFENCGLTDVTFEKQSMSETASTAPLTIHERAFADNSELWGIYFSNRTVILEKEVFVDCAETGYLCYETYQDTPSEMADSLKIYAEQFDWNTAEIPNYYSSEPIVNFPDTPLTLTPEVGSFSMEKMLKIMISFVHLSIVMMRQTTVFRSGISPVASSVQWR